MKNQMPRPGSGRGGGEGSGGGRHRPLAGVELVGENLVKTKIAGEGKMVGGVQSHAMGVRAFLAIRPDAFSCVLKKSGGAAQASIRLDGKAFNAAAVIIGHQHVFAGAIKNHV